MNNCINCMSYRTALTELTVMSLRRFIKKHYSYYEETRDMLEQMGIDPKILKNRITPEELKQFEILGISKNKVAMLLNISVSTLKKVRYENNFKFAHEEMQSEKECLQQCIDFLRVRGYSQADIAYIFCTYPDKLKRDFDFKTEFSIVNSKTDAEKLMLRKAYISGNLYNEIFNKQEEIFS